MRRRKLLVIYFVAFRAKKVLPPCFVFICFSGEGFYSLSAYCFLCFDRIQFAFCSEPLISSRLLGFHFSDGFQFVLLTSAVLLSPSFFSGNKFAPNIQECMNFHTHFGANTHPLSHLLSGEKQTRKVSGLKLNSEEETKLISTAKVHFAPKTKTDRVIQTIISY